MPAKKPAARKKSAKKSKAKKLRAPELSYDTKTLLTVFMLVTLYPVGVVLMFKWMIWPDWLKILVVLPFILLAAIGFFIAVLAIALT